MSIPTQKIELALQRANQAKAAKDGVVQSATPYNMPPSYAQLSADAVALLADALRDLANEVAAMQAQPPAQS